MPGHLLVLHTGAIGDYVLSLSVVEAVRKCLSSNRVTAIAPAASARLSAGRSAVDTWCSPEVVGLHRLFGRSNVVEQLGELLAKSACVLSFLGGDREPIHQRLKELVRGMLISVDPRPTTETLISRRHVTRQWTESIRAAGLPIADPQPPVIRWVSQPAIAAAGGRGRIVLHPGSGGLAKCWPPERFVELAESLRGDSEINWMLGPVELEQAPAAVATISERTRSGTERLICEPDIMDVADQLAGANLYVGNDAGMTHVAAALGIRTVVLFGASDPNVWRPLHDHIRIVESGDGQAGMAGIAVSQVLQAVALLRRQFTGSACLTGDGDRQ